MYMYVFIFILSLFIFFQTLRYGLYEIKKNSNIIAGIAIIIFAVFSSLLFNITIYINGIV